MAGITVEFHEVDRTYTFDGPTIRAILFNANISQKDLAKFAGYSDSSNVCRMLAKKREIKGTTLLPFVKALKARGIKVKGFDQASAEALLRSRQASKAALARHNARPNHSNT